MTTLLAAYSYNALNCRIIEDDGITATHLFYSANWQVLEEQVSGQTTTQYVWSPVYIDALILRDRDTDSDGDLDERLYVQQDANWNVTALVDALTGDVVQRFVQDPFGLVTDILDDSWSPQSDAFDWKYLHQGLRLDQAIGMNLYDGRNRIYDPVLQRWLQVDPSGFGSGDGNVYRYVVGNPVNAVDPWGLQNIPKPTVYTIARFTQEQITAALPGATAKLAVHGNEARTQIRGMQKILDEIDKVLSAPGDDPFGAADYITGLLKFLITPGFGIAYDVRSMNLAIEYDEVILSANILLALRRREFDLALTWDRDWESPPPRLATAFNLMKAVGKLSNTMEAHATGVQKHIDQLNRMKRSAEESNFPVIKGLSPMFAGAAKQLELIKGKLDDTVAELKNQAGSMLNSYTLEFNRYYGLHPDQLYLLQEGLIPLVD